MIVTDIMQRLNEETGLFAWNDEKSFNASQHMKLLFFPDGPMLILLKRNVMKVPKMSGFACQNSRIDARRSRRRMKRVQPCIMNLRSSLSPPRLSLVLSSVC